VGFSLKTLYVRPAVDEYPFLFRARKDEGCEEEEWYSTSAASFPLQIGSRTAPLPTIMG